MNITRHLYLSSAVRSPDEPAAAEPEVIEQQIQAEVAAAEPEAEVRPEPVPAAAEVKPELHGNHGKTPWFMKEIPQLREEKRQEKEGRLAAEQRAADLQAIIDRMQADPAAAAPATRPAPGAPVAAPADFNAAVKAQAAKERLYEDTMTVRLAGQAKFTDFNQSLDILNAVGATSDDFVSDVLAVDKVGAHEIFDKLAKDPEKAASLVGMDSRRRIAELTRMADAPKTGVKPAADPKPPAGAISRAPAPKPAISPLSSASEVDPTTPEGNEKMSDQEFERWYKNKYQKRA